MHVSKIVTQLLSNVIHKTRIQSLIPVITAIITSKQLRLTELGRSLNTPGKERAGIRRVDRLLANKFYQTKSINIYKAITLQVVGNQGRPIILVDWSGIPNSRLTAEEGEQRIRSYLSRWCDWWVQTTECWTRHQLLGDFLEANWDKSAYAIAAALTPPQKFAVKETPQVTWSRKLPT